MSDFGANTIDFDSDYARDFRAEGNDYASDFFDFPGDSGSDFGREVRHSGPREDGMDGSEPAAAETAPPQIDSRSRSTAAADRQPSGGHKVGGKLAAQAENRGDVDNATPQGNKQGVQRTQGGWNIGTAPPN